MHQLTPLIFAAIIVLIAYTDEIIIAALLNMSEIIINFLIPEI
jgi:hypothetical protein